MAVDPIKIQTVLRKASDQQLMTLLKRPDSIPSMFVQQEIRRRNMARQAAKADMSKMAMAQRPQLTPEMSRMDQPPTPRPQDPMASAIPMNTGGSGELAKQKQLLMQMYNAGRLNIVQGVAQNDRGELGEFARSLISANQMRPTDNKGLDISRKPQFTDFDMTDPKNNFPGSRLNYSIAPMIQNRNTEFADAKAREKELENNKSEFLNQLEKSGIKAIKSETTPMDLENEFIEGQFDPEGKFAYGRPNESLSNVVEAFSTPEEDFFGVNPNMVIKKPEMNFATTLAEDLGMSAAQSASPFISKGGIRNMNNFDELQKFKQFSQSDDSQSELEKRLARNRAMSKNTPVDPYGGISGIDPRMRTNTIGFDPKTNIGEYGFPSNYVDSGKDAPTLMGVLKKLKEDEDKGFNLLGKPIPSSDQFNKTVKVPEGAPYTEETLFSPFDFIKKNRMGTIEEGNLSGNEKLVNTEFGDTFVVNSSGEPILKVDKAPGSLTAFPKKETVDDLLFKAGEKLDASRVFVTDDGQVLSKRRGQKDYIPFGEGATEPVKGVNPKYDVKNVDITKPFSSTAVTVSTDENKDGENTGEDTGEGNRAETNTFKGDPREEKKGMNNKQAVSKAEVAIAEKMANNTGGIGNSALTQYSALTNAQNKLIEAMKPNGGDRFWQLVAEFGANLAASDSPNFMQAAGQAMQQTLAEAKNMKKEDRQMLIDQAKVAVDLEFKRAELGLQLARINASSAKSGTNSVGYLNLLERIRGNDQRAKFNVAKLISDEVDNFTKSYDEIKGPGADPTERSQAIQNETARITQKYTDMFPNVKLPSASNTGGGGGITANPENPLGI